LKERNQVKEKLEEAHNSLRDNRFFNLFFIKAKKRNLFSFFFIQFNMIKKLTLIFILALYLHSSTLNLSMSTNPSRINPILASDKGSSDIADWIFNGIFKYDKDGNIVNDLASSHKFLDDTTLIINLKKNVKWHDGEEFSSKDVLFTYNTIIDPKIFTPYTTNYKKVKSVKILDKYTIEVKYKEPYFKALEIWMMGILPFHILKDEKNIMTSSFNKKPIGTGPYTLDELKISKDVILKVNKNYFEKVPKIKKIVYKFVPDKTTSFYMLKQKQLDIGSLTAIQIDRQIDQKFRDKFTIIQRPSFGYSYVGLNLKKEKFKNKKVRQAISLAIDRKQMADILYFGYAKPCTGPFLPGSIAYNEKVKVTKQNIKKAKELLKEAGYSKDNPFSFTITTNASGGGSNVAEMIQYQLKQAHVEVKIRVVEWQAFLNTVINPRKFDAIILAWSLSLMPDARSIWHSSSDSSGGFNFIGYENKEVDRLIEKAEVTIDKKEFSKIYKKIYKLISEDVPYLFLFIPDSVTSVNKDIKNIKPAFTGIFHNQQEWEKIDE